MPKVPSPWPLFPALPGLPGQLGDTVLPMCPGFSLWLIPLGCATITKSEVLHQSDLLSVYHQACWWIERDSQVYRSPSPSYIVDIDCCTACPSWAVHEEGGWGVVELFRFAIYSPVQDFKKLRDHTSCRRTPLPPKLSAWYKSIFRNLQCSSLSYICKFLQMLVEEVLV